MKKEILNFLNQYWPEISVLVYELFIRLLPTSKNLSIVDLLLKLTGKGLQLTQKGVDTVVPNNQKNTIKSFLVFALLSFALLSGSNASAQTNVTAKKLSLTTGIAAKDTLANARTGDIYYDHVWNRLRLFQGGLWTDIGGGAGGGLLTASNGLTVAGTNVALGGPLVMNTTISGAFDLDFINNFARFNSGTLKIFNPARTFNYSFIGSAITADRQITMPLIASNRTMVVTAVPTSNRIPYWITANDMSTAAGFTFDGTTFTTPNVVSTGRITATSTATLPGINVGSFAGDPSTLVNGDMWYNSTSGNLRTRIAGASVSLGAGITNTAPANELGKSDGTNIVPSGISSSSLGNNLTIGTAAISGAKTISVASSSADEGLTITSKGASVLNLQNGSAPVLSGILIANNGVNNPAIGIGDQSTASSAYAAFAVSRNYAATNTVTNVATFSTRTTGAAANGIGTGLDFYDEDAAGNVYKSVELQTTLTDVTNGSEDGDFLIKTGSSGAAPTEKFRVTSTGISNNSGGLKHARVTTGSIAAATSALVTITWGTAFADANYTVTASVVEATTSNVSMSVVHVETVSASAVTVRVYNASAGNLTGTVQVIAIHD